MTGRIRIDTRGLVALGKTQKSLKSDFAQNHWGTIIGHVGKPREGRSFDLLQQDRVVDALHPEMLCTVNLAIRVSGENGHPLWIHSKVELNNVRQKWEIKGNVGIEINRSQPQLEGLVLEYSFSISNNELLAVKMLQDAMRRLKETPYHQYRIKDVELVSQDISPVDLPRQTHQTIIVHLAALAGQNHSEEFWADGRCELWYNDTDSSGWEPILLDLRINGEEIQRVIRYRGGVKW